MPGFEFPVFILVALALSSTTAHYGYQDEGRDSNKGFEQRSPTITQKDIEQVFKECQNVGSERNEIDEKFIKEGKTISSNQRVADLCVLRRRKTDPTTHNTELKQLTFDTASEKLIKKFKLSDKYICEELPKLNLDGQYSKQARDDCTQTVFSNTCDRNSVYRTADGTCNNLVNATWGSAGSCFRRLLPAAYSGSSDFRQSAAGGSLPEPRDLSLNVHNHLNRPTNYVNHMYMFFGQLLDHDITQTPFSVTMDNEAIQCCPPSPDSHPQCAPIAVRPDDNFYSEFGTTCINFVRSTLCPTCRLGPRDQVNQITAFIDASFLYGNSLNETLGLRARDGTGRMRVDSSANGDLLPPSPQPLSDQCSFVNTSDICFESGDARTNQHTTLASLTTVFLREHNRLADALRRINRNWDDERIFQEARKIVGAEMQVITYKEYLPITLGEERMNYFNLWISNNGWTSYDSTVNPTLYTEFSTAAFRFGHSLINSIVTQSPRTNNNEPRLLRNEFFQPWPLRDGLIDPLLSGVSSSAAQWFDRHVVPDVTNFLYRIRGQNTGLDLAAINIQRGRDHGLPGYVDVVQDCSDGRFVVRQFQDLVRLGIMTNNNMQLLRRNYRHVRDIDLWTGVLSETFNEEAVIGPTATCIIGEQFQNLKFGDRFYFEHRNSAGSFTYQQMQELKKVSLSRIICANTNVQRLPLNAMIFNTRNNMMIECRSARSVDASYWRD